MSAKTGRTSDILLITPNSPRDTKPVVILPDELDPLYLDQTMMKKWRWVMLFLCCFLVVPNYFCYDNPASLETYIESEFGKTPTEYGLLYSVYAVPNCIMPLIGGILLDKIGHRIGLIIFTTFLCVGQGIFMLGGYNRDYNLMIVGRGIFGIGCESMYVG
jgi:MFS family permease